MIFVQPKNQLSKKILFEKMIIPQMHDVVIVMGIGLHVAVWECA